jgi:hypothetical protein
MASIDTSYRTWPAADLAAMRVSCLTQIANIQGVGQTHSVNGKNTELADFDKVTSTLASVNAAISWQSNLANRGNRGYASRYASFN